MATFPNNLRVVLSHSIEKSSQNRRLSFVMDTPVWDVMHDALIYVVMQ